jgi:hypothetical protein
MCRLLTGVLFFLPLTAPAADPPANATGGLKPGDNLPGTFLPYNVTGPYKDRFHCLVCDYGLEPVVLLIARNADNTPAVNELLKRLDERIDKNPAVRLHAFVVFLSEDLPEVLTNDDKREELAKRLEDRANGLQLKHVVLCLDSAKDLQNYAPGDAALTAVLYANYRVEAVHRLIKPDAVAELDRILADVGAKLKAAKTK